MKEVFSWLKAIVVALVIAFVIRTFIFVPVIVEGESMMPTLQNADRMIVSKISNYVGELDRGDIIVFHATESKDYIKRVIAIPGDTLEYRDDTLYLNDEAVEEPYLKDFQAQMNGFPLTENFTLEQVTGETVVPEGSYFVMGDNRQNSKDSREIGFVPKEDVVGKTNFVFWPLGDFGTVQE